MTLSTRLWKLPKSTSKKQNMYNIWLINMTQSCQIKYVCVICTLWSDNTCVFTRFHSVKNANTQLIWSPGLKIILKFVGFCGPILNLTLLLQGIDTSLYLVVQTWTSIRKKEEDRSNRRETEGESTLYISNYLLVLICSAICITQILLCKRQPLCTGWKLVISEKYTIKSNMYTDYIRKAKR
jgi:uncharacterized membrane protein